MTTPTEWFGKLKSRAKSVQETAKTQIEKLTETIDKKLKEAEDDLIKQRNKAAASQSGTQQQQKWQPSAENPDGEIVSFTQPSSTG
ncbi:unnamed protein product [Rotaria sp. Silwood2]|nr:unnamed protein product [Rotaria sp. Silwood2]